MCDLTPCARATKCARMTGGATSPGAARPGSCKKSAPADVQRVFLVEKELVQVDKPNIERAKEQEKVSEKEKASPMMLRARRGCRRCRKDPAHVLPRSVSRQRKVRLVHDTRAERAGSVQPWRVRWLWTRLPFHVGHHDGRSHGGHLRKGSVTHKSARARLCSSNRASGGRYCGRT